jgi:hypothetical protein
MIFSANTKNPFQVEELALTSSEFLFRGFNIHGQVPEAVKEFPSQALGQFCFAGRN